MFSPVSFWETVMRSLVNNFSLVNLIPDLALRPATDILARLLSGTSTAAASPPFDPTLEFVSRRGTDLCVICRTDTGVPTSTHIEDRQYYVDCMGQHCSYCYNR